MPTIVAILGYIVGAGLMLFGIIGFFCKRKTTNTEGHGTLHNIPKIIQEMHERLTLLVAHMPLLTKTEIDSLREDYLELWVLDESRYPELKQITPMSDVKADREVIGTVLDRLLATVTEVDVTKSLLIKIGGLMNVKGTGISRVRDTDRQYARLESRLAKMRPKVSTELNTAIDDYLLFSFGAISLYRLVSSLISSVPSKELTKALPTKYSAEMGIMKERMNTAMNELLAEVSRLIQKPTLEAEILNVPSAFHKGGSQT